jgi:alpha-beta hydrolase superfamily lysophospholipase
VKEILFSLLILVFLPACTATGGEPSNKGEPETTSSPTAIPTATSWKLIEEEVTVPAEDGLMLAGTFYAPAEPPPWRSVILLHMIYGNSLDWGDFPKQLAEAGYAVFNLDMRGHGKTGGSTDWDQSKNDLQRVWNYLAERPDIDATCGAVIGASMGANMGLVLAADTPEVCAVGLLSPGLNYYDVATADKLMTYGSRPMLIIASDEDSYSAESSRNLQEMAEGEAELVMYSQAGHGTAMLQKEPLLSKTIIVWLDQYLKP